MSFVYLCGYNFQIRCGFPQHPRCSYSSSYIQCSFPQYLLECNTTSSRCESVSYDIFLYALALFFFSLFFLKGAIYLKRYDNFHVARSGVNMYGEAASTNAQNYFRFSLEQFASPYVTPMWPRQQIWLRRLGMWPATFKQLVTVQFNMHGFNLPYRDARALKCLYNQPHQRCVDNYRLRHL